jgi:excisionase family DNA binding protein
LNERDLSPTEVARELKVSASTVRRWSDKGWLKPTQILPGSNYRRYSREAIEDFRRRHQAGEFDEKVSA